MITGDDEATYHPLQEIIANLLSPPSKREGEGASPPPRDLLNAGLYVFSRLFFVLDVPLTEWREAFRTFARTHGATPNEIDQAEQILLGQLIQQNGIACTLTKDILVRAVTGHSAALDLTPEGAGVECVKRWRKRVQDHHTREPWMIPRRLPELTSMLYSKKILFVTGNGGCGKSVLLAEITEPIVNALDLKQSWDGFVVLESCPQVTRGWMERAVGSWAKRGQKGVEHLDRSLERLGIANPDRQGRHLLWIALDGLDERFPEEADLRFLVQAAKERNDLCILFSCRDNARTRVMSLLYPSDTGYTMRIEDDPDAGEISVPEFSESELLDVLEGGVGADARTRVELTVGGTGIGHGRMARLSPADSSIVSSLSHPRLFGAFMEACKTGGEIATDILDGKKSSLRCLARHFLGFFLRKYEVHRINIGLPDAYGLIEVLSEVARLTRNGTSDRFTDSTWLTTSREKLDSGSVTARSMLRECKAGGLIVSDGGDQGFYWRHGFVADYLTDAPVEDYWNG